MQPGILLLTLLIATPAQALSLSMPQGLQKVIDNGIQKNFDRILN